MVKEKAWFKSLAEILQCLQESGLEKCPGSGAVDRQPQVTWPPATVDNRTCFRGSVPTVSCMPLYRSYFTSAETHLRALAREITANIFQCIQCPPSTFSPRECTQSGARFSPFCVLGFICVLSDLNDLTTKHTT